LRNNEIRREIAYTVGHDPTRYQDVGSKHVCLTKAELLSIGEALRPADSDVAVGQLELIELYPQICEWVGLEYEPNVGNQWGLDREQIKAIHRAIDARPPEEVPA
jgi:hypothetical protein